MTKLKTLLWTGLCTAALAPLASAQATLTLLQTAPATVNVAQGANGSLSIDAKNTGTGSLSLQATSSSTWLVATVGAAHNCSDGSGPGCIPIQLALQTSSLAAGNYTGFVVINDPNAVNAPQTVTISVQVGPAGLPAKIDFTVTPGGSVSTDINSGASTVSASSSQMGLLSIVQDGGSPFSPFVPYKVTANGGTLALGDYTGSVMLSGSANASDNKTIPVTVHVVKQPLSGPVISLGGALNNATYAPGESLAQGDIGVLFGTQFLTGAPVSSAVPLSNNVGGVQVFINNQAVPIYYASASQINFQVPFNAAIGPGSLRVESNGTRGNTISIDVEKVVPRILRLNGTYMDYGIVTNADGSYAIPSALGGVPATVNGAIIIYGIGFGLTSPTVDSGAIAPSTEPLARLTNNPQVCFIGPTPFNAGLCVAPFYAGLAPGFIGLYQINVTVPPGTPEGDIVPIRIITDDGETNTIWIAVQQQ